MSTGGHLCPRQWRTAGTSTVSQAYSNSLNTKAINYHYQKYNYRYSLLIHHKLKINKVFFTADKFWIYKDMLHISIFSLMMSSEVNCECEDSLKKSLNLKSTECERAKLHWKIAFSIHSISPEFCQFLLYNIHLHSLVIMSCDICRVWNLLVSSGVWDMKYGVLILITWSTELVCFCSLYIVLYELYIG